MGSKRGDRSPHPWRPVRSDQTHGYKAAATDAEADPAVILPGRAALVPQGAVTPLVAQGGGDVSGGGAAEEGTVVVTPGSETDVAAALEAATAPSAENPYATEGTVGPIQVVTRTLTSPEILAIQSTPVELLPAQAGKMYGVQSVDYVYHFGTVPYVVDLGGNPLYIGVPGTFDFLTSLSTVGWLDQSADQYGYADRGGPGGGPMAWFVNQPITIRIDGSGAANPEDGDGTIDLTVRYRVLDVS